MRNHARAAAATWTRARRITPGLAIVLFFFLLLSHTAWAAYPDVPANSPYSPGIGILSGRGILEGFPDGSFHPHDPVTRAQLAKVIVLASGNHTDEVRLPSDPDAAHFPDLAPSIGVPYPYDFIEEAASLGYFQGDQEGRFNPDGMITRLQLVLVLVRAAEERLRPAPGYRTDFTDVPAWAAEAG